MNALISIVIPTYNRAHLIGATLDSIIRQSYVSWECIVIDDGSSDYTSELMEFYCEKNISIKYQRRPPQLKKGANSCRNFGFSISKGDFIQWLDDDDVLLDKNLEKKIELFEPRTKFVICGGFFTNENLNITGVMKLDPSVDLFKDLVLWNRHIITNSILFRKAFLEGKELFYPPLERGQEAEFFSRIFFQIPESFYKILDEPLFLYRQHSQSKSFKNKKYIKKFKEAQAFIAIENLKRGFILENKEIVEYCYELLINVFFLGIKNNHREISFLILNDVYKVLKRRKYKTAIIFYCLGCSSLLFSREIHRFRRNLKLLDLTCNKTAELRKK